MRLTLKHQIILAPASVLILTTLLLGYLQYSYWDLSVRRQEAQKVAQTFVALAEADLASQRLQGLLLHLSRLREFSMTDLETLIELHAHFAGAVDRILALTPVSGEVGAALRGAVDALDPQRSPYHPERYLSALSEVRPQLVNLAELSQQRREKLRDLRLQNIDELVNRTGVVALVGLSAAIPLGTLLSLFFARNLLRRVQGLSDSAKRIARGDLVPPKAPTKVEDELDELAVAMTSMTERLIRVVSTEKLLEGAEEERRRIAMDLHDQSLSDLSDILRTIQNIKGAENCRAELDKVEEDLRRAMANLRDVMDNLHPQTLEILGLGAALQSYFERHLDKDRLPEYHLYVSPQLGQIKLPRKVQLAFYRIIIEAAHNVIKHAHASRYEVTVDCRGKELLLAVEDNGRGFNPTRDEAGQGRGLHNIRQRARAIGARVQWGASRFSSGTRFELILPLEAIARIGDNGGGKGES